jgi:hypothetical protein
MKSFDPMNSSGDSDFERLLRGIDLRRPPEAWKACLLPKPVLPIFPKPLLIGLASCWMIAGVFFLNTPEDEIRAAPLLLPEDQGSMPLLGYQEPEKNQ